MGLTVSRAEMIAKLTNLGLVNPPRTIATALRMLRKQEGVNLLEWADDNGIPYNDNDYGKYGAIVEEMLGKTRDNSCKPDFGTFELKTTIIRQTMPWIDGKKSITLVQEHEFDVPFVRSNLYKKIKRVLYVGIDAETESIEILSSWDLQKDKDLRAAFEEDYYAVQDYLNGGDECDSEWLCVMEKNSYLAWAFRPRFVQDFLQV